MAYVAPSVGPAGLTIPSYEDILADNVQGFLNIFGTEQYVGPDSAIYQLLSILSLKQSDVMEAVQFAYNQGSPLTSVGAGLDRVVKMNGLARLPYGFSTALETLTGTPGTVINNGTVQDTNGNQWALPSPVTIPIGGTITVPVTCTTPGAVTAGAGQINIIATPVGGWTSATNAAAATAGPPVEADSRLRARQALSVALPSQTRLFGTIAGVAAILGVTRYAAYENPTGTTSDGSTIYGYPSNAPLPAGLPGHSITMIVEGGTNLAVATAIYNNRGIGCYTNGTTAVSVTDPNTGYTMTIRFYRPSYVPIFAGIQVHGLFGFSSATLAAVQSAVTNYLNSLQIGESVTLSALYAVAMGVNPNLSNPLFSIPSLTLDTSASGIFQVSIGANAGTLYSQGDTPTVNGGTGGKVLVTSVDGGGAVTGLAPVSPTPGTGYAVASNQGVTGGTGSNLKVNILSVAPVATADLDLLFYQVAQGVSADVVVAAV
jgi:uncharacterized phage protein gp47/JayE